jgi:membrane protease YdiL (CAAX protease family)
MRFEKCFILYISLVSSLAGLTTICEGKVSNNKMVDAGWNNLVKNKSPLNAKSVFFIVKPIVPDTFYGGKHLRGLSAAYAQEGNNIASYYYAKRALHAARTHNDSVWANRFLGLTGDRIKGVYGAQHIRGWLDSLNASGDTAFVNQYRVELEYIGYNKISDNFAQRNLFTRIESGVYGFGCRATAAVPFVYPLVGGKLVFSYLVLFVLTTLFGLMLLNARLQGKAGVRRTKLYMTYYSYIIGFFIIDAVVDSFSQYYYICKGQTDYFSYSYAGELLYLLVHLLMYLLFFIIFDKHNKWLVSRSIFTCLRRKKIISQISWGVLAFVVIRIVLVQLVKFMHIGVHPGMIDPFAKILLLALRFDIIDAIICGPVIEEVLFRWLLYRLARAMTNKWYAIGVSYIVFAMSHFRFHEITGANMLLYAGITITAVLVLERTKSVLPPIITHSLHNLLVVVTHKA